MHRPTKDVHFLFWAQQTDIWPARGQKFINGLKLNRVKKE